MKIFIERAESSNEIGEKGWGEENLQPVTMDLTELLADIQDSASKSLKAKGKLTIEIEMTVSASEKISPEVGAAIFKIGGSKESEKSGTIKLSLETELEPK